MRLNMHTTVRKDHLPQIREALGALKVEHWTVTATEYDDRLVVLRTMPDDVPSPQCGSDNVFAAWYKPTSSHDERPYVHQPLGYPALPREIAQNLNALCDHCGQFVRNQTFYIFRHLPTGGWVHVSAGCLEGFLGDAVCAGELVAWCGKFDRLADTIREAMPREGRSHFNVEEVIAEALEMIGLHGEFVSRGKARETGALSTAATVLDRLESGEAERAGASEMHEQKAKAIVQWLHEVHATEGAGVLLTDYLHNLSATGSREWVEARSVGLLCTAPGAYEAWLKQRAQDSTKPVVDPGNYFGAIDARVNADVFVDEIEERGENEFGVSILVHMHVVPTGEKLTWWTGDGLKLEEKKQYHVRMTPKKHAEWDGYRITTVNRVMVSEPPKPPAEKKPRAKKKSE